MMTRMEKYKHLREQIKKDNDDAKKTIEQILNDMEKSVNDLFIASEVLIKKIRERDSKND